MGLVVFHNLAHAFSTKLTVILSFSITASFFVSAVAHDSPRFLGHLLASGPHRKREGVIFRLDL